LVARVPIGQGDRIDVFSKCRTALEQGEIDAGASTVTGSDDRSGSFLATAVGIPAFDVDGSATRGTGHVCIGKYNRVSLGGATDNRTTPANATNGNANSGSDDLIETIASDADGCCPWFLVYKGEFLSKWINVDRALDLPSLALAIDADRFLGECNGGNANSHQSYQRQTLGFHSDSCE
jgi:hypothetical protein